MSQAALSTLLQSKAALRALAREKRSALSAEQRETKSTAICRLFVKTWLPSFSKTAGRTVALYDAINSEVDLSELALTLENQGAKILKPILSNEEGVMNFTDWKNSFDPHQTFNLASVELAKPETINIIVCPVVAFDAKKNRLGYGGGYYDRFLPRLMSDTMKIGVAYSCQEVDEVPTDVHDVPLDFIVTEDGVR